MHTLDTAQPTNRRSLSWLAFAPLLALVCAVLMAQTGVGVASRANAAAGSVAVTASSSAVASVIANGCSSAMAITINVGGGFGGAGGGTCAVSFGSSNTSGITLTADDSTQTDQFFIAGSGHMVDHAGACGPLTGDEVGYKVTAVAGSVTQNLCGGSSSAIGTNTFFSAIPNDVPAVVAGDTVCTTTAAGTTHSCTIGVNTFETGGDVPATSYSGTINLTTS